MDGRHVFDILSWKTRYLTSYRFSYSFQNQQRCYLSLNHGSLIELWLRGICGNHFQSLIQSVRLGVQSTHTMHNFILHDSNLLSKYQYDFTPNRTYTGTVLQISWNTENDTDAIETLNPSHLSTMIEPLGDSRKGR